ncbi:COP9 signalosome complex subunit 7-like [Zingiber officinale]|uniref:COP9 signalosome complex subunit 7-like n=1 Tax=Zingiber officinale TaxID=94328 RepID=UPI001C4D579E|nr:COP9 signalosome complex subunit 7-like [Zingiber officinale]
MRQAAKLSSAESVANLVLEDTSHPSLFTFAEILAIPNLSKIPLLATAFSVPFLFANLSLHTASIPYFSFWHRSIRGNAYSLPVMLPDQVRKLKQLSVLALIENEKNY